MIETKFPTIDPTLLEALDTRFPERCPEPTWSDREIWMRVGERRVVRFLRAKLDEQSKNVLGT